MLCCANWKKRRETEKRASGSISRLSCDPATGKGFRCVQNKNQGIEGLFYVAWGMEGSYHPQGRSWLLTHDPALKEGNAGDKGVTSPSTASMKPKGQLGKNKRETLDKGNILFFCRGLYKRKKKHSQKSSKFPLQSYYMDVFIIHKKTNIHIQYIYFDALLLLLAFFILIKESKWHLTFSHLSLQHMSSRCASVTKAQWACHFPTYQ